MTRLIRACFELLLRLLVKANYKLKTVHLLMTCILALWRIDHWLVSSQTTTNNRTTHSFCIF